MTNHLKSLIITFAKILFRNEVLVTVNIIAMISKFTSDFNKNFCTNLSIIGFEETFQNYTDEAAKELFKSYLEFLDQSFMNSEERKAEYTVKDTIHRKSLVTIFGNIDLSYRRYKNKDTNEQYIFIRELLNLKPYQRFTDTAEKELIKCSMETNSSYAAKHAIRNCEVSRAKVAKISRRFIGTLKIDEQKCENQPKVLYIEMDEIHANLQNGKNHICPCAIVHEGHKEEFAKRKELKNTFYLATSKGSYRDLWDIIYYYVDTKYDIDKFDVIFVSGDGASGIKQYDEVFANAVFVLDPYHYYYKYLHYIFKNDKTLSEFADSYLREDRLEDFEALVQVQIEKYPEQEKIMIENMNYLLNNVDGIKNQRHPLYKCACSMEGHVSQAYARHITSSPYAFSLDGLENKLQLLTMKANQIELTLNNFLQLKYGENEYQRIIEQFKTTQNITIRDLNLNFVPSKKIEDLDIPLPIFDNVSTQDYFKRLIVERPL